MHAGRFAHFAAIDWSGAKGARHKGIAVAICDASGGAPRLEHADRRWSRDEIVAWLLNEMPADTLVGLDLGVSLPFVDTGAFFPEWSESPANAHGLWALVERICADDPHLGVSSLVDHAEASRHYRRHGGREGDCFGGGGGRLRVSEKAQRVQGCNPYSNFNLVGAAQVGKSSLTGMRVLHRINGRVPIWPFDAVPATGSVVLEIYTTIAALAASRSKGASKMHSFEALNDALDALGSPRVKSSGRIDDHRSDALLTAAWLRTAAHLSELWSPDGLDDVRYTEGWTFGVR